MRGRPARLAVPRRNGDGMSACLRAYPTIAGGEFSVHDGYSFGSVKPEKRIRHKGVNLPILELELNSNGSALAEQNTFQVAGTLVQLKIDLFFRGLCRSPRGKPSCNAALCLCSLKLTGQNDALGIGGLLCGRQFYSGAHARHLHLSCKQCQRSPPICAFLCI